jgi:hypothetical protein
MRSTLIVICQQWLEARNRSARSAIILRRIILSLYGSISALKLILL